MTNKSIKFLAASAIALTSIGATTVLTSPEAFASSVTHTGQDAQRGEFEIVTNPFKTYDEAVSFSKTTLEKLLEGQSYRSSVLPSEPLNPKSGYEIITNLRYHTDTVSKADAETLANKLVSAADTAIAGTQPAAEKPAEAPAAEKPAEAPAAEKPVEKPVEKPADKPAETPAAEKPAETSSAEKPADKPADKKDDATKPADKKDDATKPADKKDDATKPADKKDDATKPADKKDDAKVTNTAKKSDAAQAQKVAGKETLPKTAATSGSVANTLVGVVAVAAAAFFGLKRKIFN